MSCSVPFCPVKSLRVLIGSIAISVGDHLKIARKIHWVGWNKVTKSKKEGGLGLQSA